MGCCGLSCGAAGGWRGGVRWGRIASEIVDGGGAGRGGIDLRAWECPPTDDESDREPEGVPMRRRS